MKTYVLTVSRTFPKTHKRAGEPTSFIEKIFSAFGKSMPCDLCYWKQYCKYLQTNCLIESVHFDKKVHTIRANYELWAKRAKEINDGKAILSIRYWSEKPYRSKQVEICQLTKIGVQRLDRTELGWFIDEFDSDVTTSELAKNDGLSFDDFVEWFKNYDLLEPMAIIQFTDFRY